MLSFAELNLSHNQMSKLPEELAELQALERLDISHNTFVALPPVVWQMPQLKRLLANNNYIIGQYRLTLIVTQDIFSGDQPPICNRGAKL